MRNAINENRTVQLAVVAVLVIIGAFGLLKVTKGSGSEGSTATSTTASTDPAATDPATAGVPASTDPAASSSGGASAAAVPAALVPGPGLPKSLIPSYDHGKAIVLFIRRDGGIDDGLVHAAVDRLASSSLSPDIKVYVTRAKGIARYAWLTQGVDVTELPALVVLLPKSRTKGAPTATVSYGFRDSASVLQAVEDALYRGPENRPYHP
jgi:hypothetical protein